LTAIILAQSEDIRHRLASDAVVVATYQRQSSVAADNMALKTKTAWLGAMLLFKELKYERLLRAAKNVRQCEKSGKTCECANSYTPAGFLSGFFHDYSSLFTLRPAFTAVAVGEAFIKISRQMQLQKKAKWRQF
jgi:hypothetical protein